ncbi:ATP-dependent sacrificial sulfur transferase LarE [Campylobacter sp. JMF_07 ED4]|nr:MULTISPECIES: ATP-dependent sacrificial sulfur transferase LarE [unclassified Campylobacter]MDA3043324.1 ATP-dependent sacrificial sulfur transferase LarE [Campylobacter sp. JMF_09 ED2]MDA3044987.1 ATP-dependent sacrificial sulfur transferase LarE [Campylobacter sp. JMF_07 ED4]MDA3064413.1 ATP-dependent sacrificial sulfur transferase LarE [Campylobacter sp. JMF_11 EL3]MDA3071770.1 ATP-dependent sacrificial sulfur transferase LarE [Campylobacter sp. VBCF_03 NA9]MDA3075297.1 ATP-dependent sac
MKMETLKEEIRGLKNLALAFSGGVDSSFLACVAGEILGANFIALTIKTPYMSEREISQAINFAKIHKFRHEILELQTPQEIANNPQNRCYLCKRNLFENLIKFGRNLGFSNFADGTNKDDLGEDRPGLRAVRELGVISPLINLTKAQIREYSRTLRLESADLPSFACLLTRLPHGREFSADDLKLVERVENLLIQNGFANIRARYNGRNLKIEMPRALMSEFVASENFAKIIQKIDEISQIDEILLDLKGFRKEVLNEKG